MVKSDAALRISFFTRLQLFLWEAVIRGVDLLRQVRDEKKQLSPPRFNSRSLTRLSVGFVILLLVSGAISGLVTGLSMALIILLW